MSRVRRVPGLRPARVEVAAATFDVSPELLQLLQLLGAVLGLVAWIAEDAARPGEPEHQRKARLSKREASIAQRLA